MTPQPGHHYRLNTGHRAVCLAASVITTMYVLPTTGQKIVLLNDPTDSDAIRIAEDLTARDPEAARWLDHWVMTQRERFEHYWIATRGHAKAHRQLRRWHKDPDVYMDDAVNRHWVTWQAATTA